MTLRSLATLALVALLACGGDSTATNPNSDSIAGTYSLKTMNGGALPFTYQSGTTKVVVTSDILTVADGGTWSEQGAFTVTLNGATTNQTIAASGTWVRAGSSVTFRTTTQPSYYVGTFTGSGFSLADGTFTYTFGK